MRGGLIERRREIFNLAALGEEKSHAGSGSARKWCPHCDRFLESESFPPNRKTQSGRSSWCRECHVAATREWRAENPEYVAAYNSRRRVKPRDVRCVECNETFMARRRDHVLCSPLCRRRRAERRHKPHGHTRAQQSPQRQPL